MKSFFSKPIVIAVVFFILGMGTMWGIHFYQESQRKINRLQRLAQDPLQHVFGSIWGAPEEFEEDPQHDSNLFSLEKRLHDFLFAPPKKESKQRDWFSQFFNPDLSFDLGEMNEHEDSQYYYYEFDIKNKKPKEIKVNVENGYISISGVFTDAGDSQNKQSMTFHRTFPAPSGIDPNGYTIDQVDNKLVVKFPKIETI